MCRWNLYAVAAAFAMIAMPASGAVIFEIGSVFADPGSTGNTIEVDVQNTGGSSILIGGFNFQINANLDIDFTGAGFSTSAPYLFTGDSFDQLATPPQPLNTSTGSSLSAGDISFSGDGDTLGAGQTMGLALVAFDVSPTAAPGPVTVLFSTDPALANLSDPSGNSITIDSLVGGTIDVTGVVPEPSTAAMLLAALMGLGAWGLMRPGPAASGFTAAEPGRPDRPVPLIYY
jgi:hypothetical protein